MKIIKYSSVVLVLSFCIYSAVAKINSTSNVKPAKIVGLIAARNEQGLIKNCLHAMAEYTDAIVVLDDASQDDTVAVVKSLADECRIEKIITKTVWQRDERGDKNALLKAGREIGGTHFILLDADEMFTANCMHNNWLRNQILALEPGQMIEFPMMNLWGDIEHYRNDILCNPYSDKWNCIPAVLCDDGQCNYDNNICWGPSGTMHVPRQPINRICKNSRNVIRIHDIDHGILHFKSVNLAEVALKKAWYMCLEYIKSGDAAKVNAFYTKEFHGMVDVQKVGLQKVPTSWLAYKKFDAAAYTDLHTCKKQDILAWIGQYGTDYFAQLSVWQHIKELCA